MVIRFWTSWCGSGASWMKLDEESPTNQKSKVLLFVRFGLLHLLTIRVMLQSQEQYYWHFFRPRL